MRALLFTLIVLAFPLAMKSQLTLEQQVADSACACLSGIDTTQIKSSSNGLRMACLQQAMVQNNESIVKELGTTQKREEDQEKEGLRGSLMIKVQNILAKDCKYYKDFERKLRNSGFHEYPNKKGQEPEK